MRKESLIIGIVLVVVCLGLHASAGSQSSGASEFIKLLREAENYFLDEDYDRVKMILENAQKILEQQIKLSQETRPFFDLSAPENTVKSFLDSAFLNDEQTARECWSKRVPDYWVSMMVLAMQKEIKKDAQEKPELMKLGVKTFRYERMWTGVNSYYVWAISPGEKRSEGLQFKVVRENSNWKILAFKAWEEEDWFKALIGEK